ncbi:hypothetical protein OPKNFCMD_2568 [Methylobacterium crusticola]|uniref:Gamma-glutamylcyclotransferase n=1 Tax=Methylobacterium crusticola TaxID=1697972 RepID=A0ABQ4QX39_9HYPH|nr:gamma-glutamylcyclotransferase family protein [Methylobacterium crusticola]GJD49833.1 hypothetical protein OPKNFCMD_2568 [Methylobacterium crusticola]
MPLYFAYGSNMDRAAMARRCPSSALLGLGRLHRHRPVILREGYASVLRDPAATVWGVVWDLALADVPALDRYEGVAGGLYVKAQQPVAMAGGVRRALIYLGRGSGGVPRPGYLEGVVAAARANGLPEAYVRGLEGLARGQGLAQGRGPARE